MWKSYINVDHIEKERWGPLWWILTGTPSARRFSKASKQKTGESFLMFTKT